MRHVSHVPSSICIIVVPPPTGTRPAQRKGKTWALRQRPGYPNSSLVTFYHHHTRASVNIRRSSLSFCLTFTITDRRGTYSTSAIAIQSPSTLPPGRSTCSLAILHDLYQASLGSVSHSLDRSHSQPSHYELRDLWRPDPSERGDGIHRKRYQTMRTTSRIRSKRNYSAQRTRRSSMHPPRIRRRRSWMRRRRKL
jgi:hypothetical protein